VDGPKQVRRIPDVAERELEEELLGLRPARLPLARQLDDRGVVDRAPLDGPFEDRRVRGQARERELVDAALQRAGLDQLAGDLVDPQALAQTMEPAVGRLVGPRQEPRAAG
jgi:hypothetical protein